MKTGRKARKTQLVRRPKKIRRLTVRLQKNPLLLRTFVEYGPAADTRFRCLVCGSVANELGQCCGEEMRRSVLGR